MAWSDPISAIITLVSKKPTPTQWYAALQAIIDEVNAIRALISSIGTIMGGTGSADGEIITSDGTGGSTIKGSGITIEYSITNSHAKMPTSGASYAALALKAPLLSPALTGTPTAPTAAAGTNTTQIATTAFVQNLISYIDSLTYKGVIDCSANPNYPAADAGDVYIVSVEGKIGGVLGKTALLGDMLVCNHDGSPSGDEAAVGTYWNIITVNTGAVIGPASSTDGHLVVFDGPSGKLVKGGGAVPVGGVTFAGVSETTQQAAINNGYIPLNAALTTITIPATAAVGDVVAITGYGAGLWKLAQNASQLIHFLSLVTTTGTGGYIQATTRYDTIIVRCVVANTTWVVENAVGNLDVI